MSTEQLAATPSLSMNGTIALLSLGSGEGRFNGDSIAGLHKCLDEVEASNATALITTAEGKIWSNGFDTDWLGAHKGEAPATMVATEKLFARVLTFPIPTIAAVGGHVFAGGVMLALAHDVRLMRADRGFLCLPEVDMGVVFTPGMTALLTAVMTPAAAHRTMILGARLGAPEAAALGIVAEAVPLEELAERAMATASALGGRDRATVAGLKTRIYADAVAALGATPPDEAMLGALWAATG
ncbi:MAG TPA: enoyl-CoA hydratase-related protein [Sporichthyaceae bacterium]|nr:enoyl-CoA hydratase-related protein [Sporichthyaceae bacterium]